MWSIICFETDNSVDYIPSFWFKKRALCLAKKTTARSFVEKRVDPEILVVPKEFNYYKACLLLTDISK